MSVVAVLENVSNLTQREELQKQLIEKSKIKALSLTATSSS